MIGDHNSEMVLRSYIYIQIKYAANSFTYQGLTYQKKPLEFSKSEQFYSINKCLNDLKNATMSFKC